MERLKTASFEELTHVEEIGDKIAESVRNWFAVPVNLSLVERLTRSGLKMEIDPESVAGKTEKLKGLTFVVSGVFKDFSRDGIKETIEQNGGKVSGSVSKKTSYLLAGDEAGPSKLTKAQEVGVKIISEEEFKTLLQ
jgi:DNA ligase (NAD+)